MEKNKTTKEDLKKIDYLINVIRLTRETWCDIQKNEKLKESNSYKKYSDTDIIINALQFMLNDEEFELNELFEKEKGNTNDKTN